MLFYTDQEISPRLGRSPEGFLVCRYAVLARCGEQIYAAEEIPSLEPDDEGLIVVTRSPREVFRPRSLASFTGKPITLDHPDAEVTGDNYRVHAIGHVIGARRGEGADADVVLGDLFITDPRAAQLIERGTHRSLSVGYNADYIPTGPGRARQVDIIANHLALLPNGAARCGPRCAIGDRKPRKATMKREETSQECVARLAAEWRNRKRRTRDQVTSTPQTPLEEHAAALRLPNQSVMGAKPYGSIGGSLIARLPGSKDRYALDQNGPDETALLLRPGYSVQSRSTPQSAPSLCDRQHTRDAVAFRQIASARAREQQAAGRAMADRIATFWKEQARHG
jgi:hypothetical protein